MMDQIATHPLALPVAAGLYLALANLLALNAFWLDKRRAVAGGWRVPERTLLMLAMMGGWPGAKLAQAAFRHKTRKQPFGILLNLSVLVLPGVLFAASVATDPATQAALQSLLPQSEIAATVPEASSATAMPESAKPRRFGPGS